MKSIAFFNNKGGVGKTSLVYHLAWMYAELGLRVLAIDLDPQSNLSAMFCDEDTLEHLWRDKKSIADSLQPLIARKGDISEPYIEYPCNRIGLILGSLELSQFEDLLSQEWPKCLGGEEAAFRVLSAFYRIMMAGATAIKADLILMDVGPNLGAINRSALIAADEVVLPLAADLFSIQGLRNLGPTLRKWREEWKKRQKEFPVDTNFQIPKGEMKPLGYVAMQHGIRETQPVKASYLKRLNQIPKEYRAAVLNKPDVEIDILPLVDSDPHCLSLLKYYRSLMPLAMSSRLPMFSLKSSDGAIGAHTEAVKSCHKDFKDLATRIAKKSGFAI